MKRQFYGPYKVIEKVGIITYHLELADYNGKHPILNMLLK